MTTKETLHKMIDELEIIKVRLDESPYCEKHQMEVYDVKAGHGTGIVCGETCQECNYLNHRKEVYFEGF